jgi:hypothetical protein
MLECRELKQPTTAAKAEFLFRTLAARLEVVPFPIFSLEF